MVRTAVDQMQKKKQLAAMVTLEKFYKLTVPKDLLVRPQHPLIPCASHQVLCLRARLRSVAVITVEIVPRAALHKRGRTHPTSPFRN